MSLEVVLFLFIAYGIIGWLWETPYVSIKNKKYINRGFLRGPYIPIYGLACVTIILTMGVFTSLNPNSISTILLQIIYIAFISAIWEYTTSWFLESVFKMRWWDYSDRAINLNGRIALDYTVLFGIGGYVLWRFINPVIINLYELIPSGMLLVVLMVVYLIFIVDSIYTLRDLIHVRTIMSKLEAFKSELLESYDELVQHVSNAKTPVLVHARKLLEALDTIKVSNRIKFNNTLDDIQKLIKSHTTTHRLFTKFTQSKLEFINFINTLRDKKR